MSILEPGVVGSTADTPRPRIAYVLRALALLASVVSLCSLWFSEKARVADDLQLSMEATARPGEQLALRAFYLRDVEAPQGPSLETVPVTVTLYDARDRQIAQTQLKPGLGDPSMEGALQLPSSATGSLRVEARAQLGDRAPLVCRRTIEVFDQAPRLAARFREALPLQQLAIGSLRPTGSPVAGLALEPRIVGGTCVPDRPCLLLVWVGQARVSVTVRPDTATTVSTPKHAADAALLPYFVTIHGPESVIVLEARVGSELVAERTVRLPVALGEAPLDVSSLAALDGVPYTVEAPPGRHGVIVDGYFAGRWSFTRAHAAQGRGRAGVVAHPPLREGLLRLQAHADRFSGENASARVLYVAPAGQGSARSIAEIARLVRAEGYGDSIVDLWRAQPPATSSEELVAYAAFMLAPLEAVRLPLPRAVSGRPRELARLSRAQTALRFGVAGVLALSAIIVGLTLMRRGLTAQREAEAILREGELETGVERNRETSSSVVFVVCLVLVVCLAFLTGALLIVAKPLWF